MRKAFCLLAATCCAAACSVPIDTGLGGARQSAEMPDLSPAVRQRLSDGEYAYQTGNPKEGMRLFEEQAADMEGDERLVLAETMSELAVSQAMRGNTADALQLHTRALEMRREILGDSHPKVAESLNFLGATYYRLQRYGESEAAFRRALEIRRAALGSQHRLTGLSANNLAFFYAGRDRFAEAEPLFVESIEILDRADGATSAEKVRAYDNYVAMLLDAGREEEAERVRARSEKYRTKRKQIEDIIHMTR